MARTSRGLVSMIGYASWIADVKSTQKHFAGMENPTYVVGSATHYAIHVEYGTYRMQAQPHLRPATDAMRGNISKYFRQGATLDGAMKMAATALASDVQRRAPVDTGKLRASYAPPVKL